MSHMSMAQQLIYYFNHNSTYVLAQFLRHFLISIYGVLLAALVGIPMGILIAKRGKLKGVVMGAANVIQTIPSLAMISRGEREGAPVRPADRAGPHRAVGAHQSA